VTFEQTGNSNAVFSAHGQIAENRYISYAVRHTTTYVWSAKQGGAMTDCEWKFVGGGAARISKLPESRTDVLKTRTHR
jgi:hypothetical protein